VEGIKYRRKHATNKKENIPKRKIKLKSLRSLVRKYLVIPVTGCGGRKNCETLKFPHCLDR
jgi:hypothetical protein